jgi:hypothetical protein
LNAFNPDAALLLFAIAAAVIDAREAVEATVEAGTAGIIIKSRVPDFPRNLPL